MAIHVRLEKVSEDEHTVVYRFGPLNNCTGIAEFDKTAETVTEVRPATSRNPRADFSNARYKIYGLYRKGQGYPDVTDYSA